MFEIKWLDLQLFAGEGAGDGGSDGAETGVEAADPGRQRLLELGVPADKIRKNRAYSAKQPAQAPATAGQDKAQAQQPQQTPAATDPTEEKKNETSARMSWEEISKDPEYSKEIQRVVQSRLRSAKGAEEAMGKLAPAIDLIARKYGQDPAKLDYDALANAIRADKSYFEDDALEMGTDVDDAQEKVLNTLDTARQQRVEAQTIEEQRFHDHIKNLEQQGEKMKSVFPNFNLQQELRNPAFARMTSPNVGISVEDAYYAVHRREIMSAGMQVTAQKTASMISNSIQAGNRRPAEAGISGQAPSVTTFDYKNASAEQRNALKQRIRSAAARGEKVYPGQ